MIHCCIGVMAYNEEANIRLLLQALLVQKTEKKIAIDEIVVVASGTTRRDRGHREGVCGH